jgi:hypothetical protein
MAGGKNANTNPRYVSTLITECKEHKLDIWGIVWTEMVQDTVQ